ncbi:MAG: type II secretion system F family protein [Ilumatobacteraceae bacterium]
MVLAAVLAGALGGGILLIGRALFPPPRALRTMSEELLEPRRVRASAGGAKGGSERLAARLTSAPSARLAADLAVLGRTPTRHTLDQLGYAVAFTTLGLLPGLVLPLAGLAVPVIAFAGIAVAFGAVGWLYPELEVRSRAAAARKAWAQVVTVYVDIVGISLAGGAGVEDALMVAAQSGTGPQFEELAATLRAAQTRRHTLWSALDELGARSDIVALRELSSAVDLAAEAGSRIRETLLAKAGAMRVRQLTDAEADAQKSSETMGIAPALMAVAAVVLIGYPAVARFLE